MYPTAAMKVDQGAFENRDGYRLATVGWRDADLLPYPLALLDCTGLMKSANFAHELLQRIVKYMELDKKDVQVLKYGCRSWLLFRHEYQVLMTHAFFRDQVCFKPLFAQVPHFPPPENGSRHVFLVDMEKHHLGFRELFDTLLQSGVVHKIATQNCSDKMKQVSVLFWTHAGYTRWQRHRFSLWLDIQVREKKELEEKERAQLAQLMQKHETELADLRQQQKPPGSVKSRMAMLKRFLRNDTQLTVIEINRREGRVLVEKDLSWSEVQPRHVRKGGVRVYGAVPAGLDEKDDEGGGEEKSPSDVFSTAGTAGLGITSPPFGPSKLPTFQSTMPRISEDENPTPIAGPSIPPPLETTPLQTHMKETPMLHALVALYNDELNENQEDKLLLDPWSAKPAPSKMEGPWEEEMDGNNRLDADTSDPLSVLVGGLVKSTASTFDRCGNVLPEGKYRAPTIKAQKTVGYAEPDEMDVDEDVSIPVANLQNDKQLRVIRIVWDRMMDAFPDGNIPTNIPEFPAETYEMPVVDGN